MLISPSNVNNIVITPVEENRKCRLYNIKQEDLRVTSIFI